MSCFWHFGILLCSHIVLHSFLATVHPLCEVTSFICEFWRYNFGLLKGLFYNARPFFRRLLNIQCCHPQDLHVRAIYGPNVVVFSMSNSYIDLVFIMQLLSVLLPITITFTSFYKSLHDKPGYLQSTPYIQPMLFKNFTIHCA